MIKINLLPQEMIGGKGGPAKTGSSANAGAILVAAVLIILLGANVVIGLVLWSSVSTSKAELAEVTAKNNAVKEELATTEVTYNEQSSDVERMNSLISVYEALDPANHILWSEKLNMLPLLVPQNVYLTEVVMSQAVREVETEESIKARNDWKKMEESKRPKTAPEPEKVPLVTNTFRMTGIAYVQGGTDTQRLEQISHFYKNLLNQNVVLPFNSEEREFMDAFAGLPGLSPVLLKNEAGRDVSTFNFTLRTKPIRIQ